MGHNFQTKKEMVNYLYGQFRERGFECVMAHQYYADGRSEMGYSPIITRLELVITTPYRLNGRPVMGYTDSTLSMDNKDRNGLTVTGDCELHVEDERGELHNMDDLFPTAQKPLLEVGSSGGEIDLETAYDQVSKAAAVYAEFPHVATYEEYMSTASFRAGRLGLPKPQDSEYDDYLRGVEEDLASGKTIYVGEVTKDNYRTTMSRMWETSPEYQQAYAGWADEQEVARLKDFDCADTDPDTSGFNGDDYLIG